MNETRLSYGSSRNGANKVGGQPSIGGGQRNVSNPRDARASQAVNDWASKKKEQIERAKLLREQRKHGSSHLKSAGETQMTPQSTNMRTSQHSGSQQPFGSNNHLQPPQYDQQYGQNYNEYLSEGKGNGGRHSPMYGSNMRQQNNHGDFNSMYDQNSTPQNRQFEGMTSNGQYGNFGEQPLSNDQFLRKQYSYGNTPMEQDNGRHHTISHDLPRGGPSYHQQQHQMPSNGGTELKTTFSGGFSHNPLSRRGPNDNGGYQNLNHTTDHDQARYMRSTAYSKQDVQEARDGLKLLKNKMDNLGSRKGISNSQSTNRERPDPSGFGSNSQNQSMNYMGGNDKYSNRRSNNMNQQAHKPPMMPPSASQANPLNYSNMDPMNTSALSGNGPTPQNKQSNYRRAFKPNIPTSNSNPGSQFQENPINNRQSLKVSQQESSYEPEKRSPMLRRNVSNSNKQNSRKQPPMQNSNRGGYGYQNHQQQYDDDEASAFGQKGGPARVANSPKGGVRPSPITKSQPKQSHFGSANIYEQAAMNADPDSNPFGEVPPADDGTRIPCPTCGRKFNAAALAKHSKICKKVFVNKRQAFDAKAARAPEGLEEMKNEQKYNKPYGQKAKAKPKEDRALGGKPMPKWKAQSLMFRQAMQANGGGSKSGGGGGMGAQAAAQLAAHAEQMDDRITCPFCNRKFAEESGKRHIPHCERKHKENLMKNGGKPKAPAKRGTQVGFGKQR